MNNTYEKDIQNIINLLDGFCAAEESRLKIEVTETAAPETVERRYHHGRCDVGSPWAKGIAFDVVDEIGE